MSSKSTEYVSCIRINGEPILPPILTEDDRRQCRIYRQQAIEVEKRLQEKREKMLKERRELESVEEESFQELDVSDNYSSSSSAVEVLDFIRQALGDSNNLEEVKYLISQVGEELKKRRSEGSRDSTSNDVDSISFNQDIDSHSFDTEGNYFDRESVGESIIHVDNCLSHSDKKTLAYDVPDLTKLKDSDILCDINAPNTSNFVNNITSSPPFLEKNSSFIPELNTNEIMLDSQINISPVQSSESEIITPPKLIRSNSYTLESPSPSVVAYLRSMTLGNSNEKSEDSSKVVKNLNNYWEEIAPRPDLSLQTFSQLEDGNENLKSLESNNLDYKPNAYNIDLEKEDEVTPHEENDESYNEIMRAAMIIQAAGRGFLVRRLMKTQKIKDLKVIIKEAVLCAWSLYGEQAVSPADIQLHERIIQQVTAACYELHCIFFNWSAADRMALIRADREKMKNPKPKFRASRERRSSDSDSLSSSTRSKSASSISGVSRSSTQRELQRPTTLPSNPRTNVMYKHWSRS